MVRMDALIPSLVSTNWLFQHLDDPNLIILDASQPTTATGSVDNFQSDQYVPNTRYFDLKNDFSDKSGDLPATFPKENTFQESAQKLGINSNSKIVVYDNRGIYFSPRVWWMFKAMGHNNVAVLDGGLPQWLKDGYPFIDTLTSKSGRGNFQAELKSHMLTDMTAIQDNLTHRSFLLIDARSQGRFEGKAPEPRKELVSGHIPNSLNIPFNKVLRDGKYLPKEDLRALFKSYPMDSKRLVFSCGSGVTACIVLLAVEMALDIPTSLYDGSWTEWCQISENPIDSRGHFGSQ